MRASYSWVGLTRSLSGGAQLSSVDVLEAIRDQGELQGAYSMCLLHRFSPGEIVTVKFSTSRHCQHIPRAREVMKILVTLTPCTSCPRFIVSTAPSTSSSLLFCQLGTRDLTKLPASAAVSHSFTGTTVFALGIAPYMALRL